MGTQYIGTHDVSYRGGSIWTNPWLTLKKGNPLISNHDVYDRGGVQW